MKSSLTWYNAPKMIVLNKADNSTVFDVARLCSILFSSRLQPKYPARPRIHSDLPRRTSCSGASYTGAYRPLADLNLIHDTIIGPVTSHLPPAPPIQDRRLCGRFIYWKTLQAPLQASRPMISISPRLINECGLYTDFFTQSATMRGVYSSAGYNRVRGICANLR